MGFCLVVPFLVKKTTTTKKKQRKTKNQRRPNVQRRCRGSEKNKQQMQAIVSQCQFKYPIRSSWFSLIFKFDWDLHCFTRPWLEGSLSLPGNSLRWWLCVFAGFLSWDI